MPDLFIAPPDQAPRSAWRRECSACGACCSAPDIAALAKPLGVPCVHLAPEQPGVGCLCRQYHERPQVCRNYRPDWVCGEVSPLPTLTQRTQRFLELYGLEILERSGPSGV
ncbi:YkgJ family cysteine cluster protein [Deinococcus sonorensis]|uniref:YkgJ family cysteine cluster protein n=2 Tax=Deinococcus sonorensis TaxID=309891 RepID=A0AAU7UB05_9DEIO